MTKSVASDATKIDVIDQNFASPKRKDCKLDTNLVSPSTINGRAPKSSPSHTAIVNGKRNHKNAGGSKANKKSPSQTITKYFHTNGHNDSNSTLNNSKSDADTSQSEVQFSETVTLQSNGDVPDTKRSEPAVEEKQVETTVPILNGSILMSPEAKLLQNGVKQTTPHRIVIRSSPTKKQRLYAKDPVEVFSNLNIRDGAAKSGKKTKQKTRRKLNVNEVENHENGISASSKSLSDEAEQAVTNGESVTSNAVLKSVSSKSTSDASENKSISTETVFPVPKNAAPRRVQSTQLTDYFPIRRSGRKTKQAVEQEISQHIEMAIEKQLEDGLIVKVFSEKGRGIVAGRPFQRGEFVVEYIGELIDQMEADRREEDYAQNAEFGCYMYYFKHKEIQWW